MKIIKKTTFLLITAITVAIIVAVSVFVQFLPTYRISKIRKYIEMYSCNEISKLLFDGSETDRSEAQSVLRLADKAFSDVQHTKTENDEQYGLLGKYATPTDTYGSMAYNEHSLVLWSAHLGFIIRPNRSITTARSSAAARVFLHFG